MCETMGSTELLEMFAGKLGYWKLLIDFKMYDNDGVGSPQTVVKPDFDMDSAMKIMGEYKGGHQRLPVAQDVVDDFVAEYKGKKNVETRFALSGKKVDNENTRAARYTDQEYHAYGWARENDIITKGENEDYRSKFAALKSGMAKYPQTKRGEYIIPAYDLNVPEFENIDNVLVYVKGTIDKPKITSIIRIYSYNETEIDKIRRYIYDCERRGVQPKTGELFDRYDAADFAVRSQISASSSGYSSRDGLYGSGSSSKNNGIDKRRLAGLDSEYLELAKNPEKNEARLREIVEEAAKVAMPDSKVIDSDGNMKNVFHGTSKGGHTQFDTYDYYSKFGLFGNGTYFTEDKVIAEQYTKKGRGNKPQVYSVFLNITNPIDMDAKADIEAWNKALQKTGEDFSLLDGDMTNEQAFKRMVEDLEYAEVYSYDAAEIVRNVFENMGYNGITHIGGGRAKSSDGTMHRVWIAFYPEQIKSAEPITYDDNGNVIPLSERFNSEKSDIRYSL